MLLPSAFRASQMAAPLWSDTDREPAPADVPYLHRCRDMAPWARCSDSFCQDCPLRGSWRQTFCWLERPAIETSDQMRRGDEPCLYQRSGRQQPEVSVWAFVLTRPDRPAGFSERNETGNRVPSRNIARTIRSGWKCQAWRTPACDGSQRC